MHTQIIRVTRVEPSIVIDLLLVVRVTDVKIIPVKSSTTIRSIEEVRFRPGENHLPESVDIAWIVPMIADARRQHAQYVTFHERFVNPVCDRYGVSKVLQISLTLNYWKEEIKSNL